jgi:hypothetical protein
MYGANDVKLSRGHSRKSTDVGWEDAKETVYIHLDDEAELALSLEEAAEFISNLHKEINKKF